MRKFIVLAIALVIAFVVQTRHERPPVDAATGVAAPSDSKAARQVSGSGTVIRILPDDDAGDRHQRFILRLPSGATLLVAHNVDIAPRVEPLHEGDTVEYMGEFAWNPEGGVVHWTHHDPAGRHAGGWLRRDGRTFE